MNCMMDVRLGGDISGEEEGRPREGMEAGRSAKAQC
jgi:hypothetical protein